MTFQNAFYISIFFHLFKNIFIHFLSCYWCTGPRRSLSPSLRTTNWLILQLQRPANAVVNQSAETHLLSSWERTGSSHLDFTRRSVHAYKTARLPRCSPHTRLWAFHGGDLSPSSPPPPLPLTAPPVCQNLVSLSFQWPSVA